MSEDPSKIDFTFNRKVSEVKESQPSAFMQDLSREDKIVQGKERLTKRLESETLKEIVRSLLVPPCLPALFSLACLLVFVFLCFRMFSFSFLFPGGGGGD